MISYGIPYGMPYGTHRRTTGGRRSSEASCLRTKSRGLPRAPAARPNLAFEIDPSPTALAPRSCPPLLTSLALL